MNILFLTTNWPTETAPVNGIFVKEHAAALAGRADVRVVYLERAGGPSGAVAGVERVRYRRFGRPVSYGAFLAGAVRAYRRLHAGGFEPDVIHAHSFLSALPALFLGRRHRKPVVYTEHWTIFVRENPGELSRPMGAVARLALRRADAVLPVSVNLADALRRLAPDARIQVVPNVVDEGLFRPGTRERSGRPPRLLTAGLLDTDAKGVDLLLEALALLDGDVGLDIAGDGVRRSGYEQLAQQLGLSGVVFHGLLPKAELAARMRASDLFVLGSRYENNPCVVLEALASGLPVVATRVGGLPELVDDGNGVLAQPHDAEALADAIRTALGRLDDFDRFEISRHAHERYGRRAVGTRLAEVYEEVLARRAR